MVWKWILGSPLLLLAVGVGVVLAPVVFLVLAFVVTNPRVLEIAGVMAGGLVTGALSCLLGHWLARGRRRRMGLLTGTSTAVLLLAAAEIFMFRPRAGGERPQVDQAGIRFETLATGSRIAIRVIEAQTPVRRGTAIFVHGGPGADAATNGAFIAALSPLADAGFDLCLYDQIGCGLSARLDNPEHYTSERQVADLEALRQLLGWERPVLIGESWGAQLIARYAADHPLGIAATVLVSPGPLRPADWADRETGSIGDRFTDEEEAAFNNVLDARLVTAFALIRINPRAAFRYLPQAEAERYGSAVLGALLPGGVCDSGALSDQSEPFLNLWVAQMTVRSLAGESPDRLDGLDEARFPVLVLRGDCDYGHEDIAAGYVDAFPRGELVPVADCGHFMLLEKPVEFLLNVSRFLDASEL